MGSSMAASAEDVVSVIPLFKKGRLHMTKSKMGAHSRDPNNPYDDRVNDNDPMCIEKRRNAGTQADPSVFPP